MRHASAEISPRKRDFDRLLTNNGQIEAKKTAIFLSNYQIDKMIVSYVKRTTQTSDIIRELISPNEIDITKDLYKKDCEKIIDLLSTQEDRHKSILILGHNPHIYDIALELAETNSREYASLLETTMTPAMVVVIDFPKIESWQNIGTNRGNITKIFAP